MVNSSPHKNKDLQKLQKEIEELKGQLQEKEMIFNNILDGMIAGYWDWHIPSEYEYMSPSFKEMLGYQDHEIPNHPDSWPMVVHPDDLPILMDRFNKHVASGGELPFDNEARFLHKDGSTVWVHCKGKVVEWDEEGNPIRMVGNHVNINHIKKSELRVKEIQEKLFDKSRRYELAANATGFGIWELDLVEMVCIWDENMFGLYHLPVGKAPAHEVWLNNYVHPEDQHLIGAVIEKAIRTKEKCDVQFRIIREDGQIRHITSMVLVDLNEEGVPYRLIGSNIDITKALELERQQVRSQQLEQKNKELEQFAYIASHDMQEPLRTVNNFVGLINKKYKNQLDNDADKYLSFITDATTRMSDLVKGLLDYSRIGISKKMADVNCNDLIEDIQIDLKALISETNASFLLGNLPIIKAYPTELRVLFQNLMVNAIKFKKENSDPVIKISCKSQNDYWQFSVEDNGIGIAKEDQEKIFIIFQRLHTSGTFEGTGIGLAHSERIVSLHDGRLWVESTVGKGSTFHFTVSKKLLGQ